MGALFPLRELVFQALQGSGDLAAPVDELIGGGGVHRHNGAAAQQATEVQLFASLFAHGGDHTLSLIHI